MPQTETPLIRWIQYLFLLFLIVGGLYFSVGVLMPLALAGILAMLFLPLSRWLENKGLNRTVSAVICVLLLVLVIAGLISLFSWRVSNLQANLDQLQQQANHYLAQLQQRINNSFGVSKEQQDQFLKKQGATGAENYIASLAMSLLGSVTTFVLILIYVFLFINSRRHFKNFVLKLVAKEKQAQTLTIMGEATGVAQDYLSGLAKMIGCLWVMYGIGFSLIGIENAFFFAILCGTLEIVPFVGNLTGTGLTVLMALAQGGGGGMVISVLITYGLVQFIQSYILQPLVVGRDVDINPFFTILVLVVGDAIWGIGGMVLSIPLLGMLKIVFDHVEPLKPYGYLIGNGEDKKQDKPLTTKLKSWFDKVRK